MKQLIILTLLLASAVGMAVDEEFLKETGGYVIRQDPGNGLVLIVNAQSRLPEDKISKPVKYMRFHAKMNIDIKTIESASVKEPSADYVKSLGATIGVFVKNDPTGKSAILVSPDERWATVNVSALNADDPGEEVLALRTRKAINRVLCLVCGAGGSQYPNTLVGPFKDGIKDYDRFSNEGLPPDVFGRMQHYLKTLGVRPVVRTTYINACQQGWAPAPTNEVQRAIWDKVHAMPTEPLKIKPEAKKQEK